VDVTFKFVLESKNPYPVGLKFDGMTLDFNVEGAKSDSFTGKLSYESIIKLVKD
jgi:hypothetical protein